MGPRGDRRRGDRPGHGGRCGAAGYRTLLLEAYDFAKGTSSRSTKLVHGGVRYLAEGDLALVREALHERGACSARTPRTWSTSWPFVVPAYSWWSGPLLRVGPGLYDLLAGPADLGTVAADLARRGAPARPDPGAGAACAAAWSTHDGQFDDARLAIALLRTLLDLGGTALNYVPVTGLIQEDGAGRGVSARDAETGEEFAIKARAVVNATGVFADAVRHARRPRGPAP